MLGGQILASQLRNVQGVYLTMDDPGLLANSQLATILGGGLELSGQNISFPQLTSAESATIVIRDVQADLSHLTSLTGSSLTVTDGGTAMLDAVTNINGSNFWVYEGVTLALPAVTSYAHASTGSDQIRTWRAEGAGSVLSLPNVTSVTGGTYWNTELDIQAFWGGQVLLPSLTEITEVPGVDNRERAIDILAQGADSRIDLSSLASFTDLNGTSALGWAQWSTISGVLGGQILAGQLRNVQGVYLTMDGPGLLANSQLATILGGGLELSGQNISFPQLTSAESATIVIRDVQADLSHLTSLTGSSLTVTDGGTAMLDAVTNINGSNFWVYEGVTLALPAVTSYAHASTGSDQIRTWRAEGAGSVLSLPNVTSVTGGTYWNTELDIQAFWGGQVLLPSLTEITEVPGVDNRERLSTFWRKEPTAASIYRPWRRSPISTGRALRVGPSGRRSAAGWGARS